MRACNAGAVSAVARTSPNGQYVIFVPAREPVRISTSAPASGLPVLSETMPLITIDCSDDGLVGLPQPAAKSTHPHVASTAATAL